MSTGFDQLHSVVQHHVVNSLGWRELRPLQDQAVAPILAGEHVLALAPTASGQAEAAFAEARDCVIVSTSTSELGIDVGDLDRVIQIDSPTTVASFLQRLGRTGRRAGTTRNMLFLTTGDGMQLLAAVGMLHLWSQG